MRAPFSRAAEGARLPDGNPNLSATLALTQKYNIVTDATGSLDVTVLPNLYCHSFSSRGSISGGNNLVLAATTNTLNTLHNSVSDVAAKNGLGFDVATLNTQYSRYRVVSYGVRVRSTTGIATTGEFTTAVLALKGMTPVLSSSAPLTFDGMATPRTFPSYWGGYAPRSTFSATLASLGLPSSGADNAAVIDIPKLPNTPCHAVASAAQVAQRGLHIRGLPFESRCRDYISTSFSALGTDSVDVGTVLGDLVGSTYGVQQVGVDMSFSRVAGTESVVVAGTGFPASTTIGSIEVIYHVEAMTNPNYSLLCRPTGQVPRVAGSQTLDQALVSLHRVPRISFSDVVQTVGDAMLGEIEGRVGAAAGGAVSGLGGMLGRLMMAGV